MTIKTKNVVMEMIKNEKVFSFRLNDVCGYLLHKKKTQIIRKN